ncbi:Glutathione synthetase-like Protein [Tribolium castaneum]|uniref:Glutathione synthetase n=1 Tax=Tribolium castaneum TaxID=7070 RepID=D6WQX2_TRICA|nr:Glutathione synthetase-like Protein [Tribolium castaneum]
MSQKTSHLLPIIPLPLSEAQLKEIVEKSKDWVLMHGISMRPKTQFDEDGLRFLPFVLIPSVFPRKEFEKACEMQSILNELMHKVAHDRCFFTESLKDIVKVDEFTRNLFRIYETVVAEGLTQAPSIHYHLAGTKKVQQTLAKPGALEQFLSDPLKVAKVKQIFGGLYSLDSDELGEQAVQMAIDDPEKFVLKPQREGGGNNVYGLEVRDAVKKMKDSEERTAWILMERIRPPLTMGYMVRPGGNKVSQLVEVVSELGIYGVVIGDAENITYSKQVGHILRTKPATANEGSTSSGPGALDSPHLID